MTKRDIRRAARLLQDWSDAIDVQSMNCEAAAIAERDEMRRLSGLLYAMAREPRQAPLKGINK